MIKPYYEHNGITIYHGDCLEITDKYIKKGQMFVLIYKLEAISQNI